MTNFSLYSQYYDLLYTDKETESECAYILSTLHKAGVTGSKWLEFGAGSGRHGRLLAQSQIKWTGVERSEKMALQGQQYGLDLYVGDIRDCCIAEQAFDAVLALFHVVSYLTSNQDVLATFKNAHRQLKPGGLFFFDVWYSPAVLTQLPGSRTKKVQNDTIVVDRIATPTIYWNQNTVNVHYEVSVTEKQSGLVGSFEEDHLMRHFSTPEIMLFADIAGFSVIHSEEWLHGTTPGQNTWGVAFLLKKT